VIQEFQLLLMSRYHRGNYAYRDYKGEGSEDDLTPLDVHPKTMSAIPAAIYLTAKNE
jgi:hypothetical protein